MLHHRKKVQLSSLICILLSSVFQVILRYPCFSIVFGNFSELANLVRIQLKKCKSIDTGGICYIGWRNRFKYDLVRLRFAFQVVCGTAGIINPGLLPLFRLCIIGIETFTLVPEIFLHTRTCPFLQHNATIENQRDLAVASFFAFRSESFPTAEPEIELPVNRIGATWSWLFVYLLS